MSTSQPDRPTVLVVEDDPWARTTTAAVLSSAGYAVAEARNGEEGVFLAHQTQPDLILLDIGLPTQSGLDVLRKLKCEPPTTGIPVVILSAYADLVHARDANLADGLMVKPYDIDSLLSLVSQIVTQPRSVALVA